MACKYYVNCENCANNNDCPSDHYGDGSPWCGDFTCIVEDCKRTECISYEEQLFEYMDY